jgi:carnitine-CoA ligase
MDIRTSLDAQAAIRGEHPFPIWEPLAGGSQQWSYWAFVDRVQRFAAGLCQRGGIAGDRIIVHLDNCTEGLIASLGCADSGAVPVTINAKATRDDRANFAQHSGAVAAIPQPPQRPSALMGDSSPATGSSWALTAACISLTGSRICSRSAARM